MNEDYFFPVTADGRGSSVEVLPGGQNLGEIDDLRYFNNRLARGLRVPSSYLPTGPDDNTTPLSDGRVGTAMIQEFRFNQYCERLQNYIALKLDEEFKLFLRWRGLNIDSGLFQLKFNPPQNFAAYRQSELDNARVGTFSSMEAFPYISKRFALERFLGLTEEEITKNEELWREENNKTEDEVPAGQDLRNIGVSVGDIETDEQTGEEMEEPETPDGEEIDPEIAGPVQSTPGAMPPAGPPA
jgi:Bacteriophage T4-like portal protein (Gp20)